MAINIRQTIPMLWSRLTDNPFVHGLPAAISRSERTLRNENKDLFLFPCL
jgi:hypothetical protein